VNEDDPERDRATQEEKESLFKGSFALLRAQVSKGFFWIIVICTIK